MIRRPPRSTRTDTLFPYTTLFRSALETGVVTGDLHLDGPSLDSIRGAVLQENMSVILKMLRSLRRQSVKNGGRSEEHTSELQSLMRISYAVFCLKKKNTQHKTTFTIQYHRATEVANYIQTEE